MHYITTRVLLDLNKLKGLLQTFNKDNGHMGWCRKREPILYSYLWPTGIQHTGCHRLVLTGHSCENAIWISDVMAVVLAIV